MVYVVKQGLNHLKRRNEANLQLEHVHQLSKQATCKVQTNVHYASVCIQADISGPSRLAMTLQFVKLFEAKTGCTFLAKHDPGFLLPTFLSRDIQRSFEKLLYCVYPLTILSYFINSFIHCLSIFTMALYLPSLMMRYECTPQMQGDKRG